MTELELIKIDPIIERIDYDGEEERQLFLHCDSLEIEYRKKYKGMYGRMMSVPRGQASYTLDETIHYDYKVSGGSPPNKVMTPELKKITAHVNEKLGTNFNTILMNVYKSGNDCIGYHRDKENGWAENSGFATLSLGVTRDFQIRREADKDTETIPHESGMIIYMPHPMNHHYLHGVPVRKKVNGTRISLTFREIIDKVTVPDPA